MHPDYVIRAGRRAVRHPKESIERIRGRFDARSDRRLLATTPPSVGTRGAVTDPSAAAHLAIGAPWPCPDAEAFAPLWDTVVDELHARGARTGLASYRGWNDGDRAMAATVWCLVAHLRPATVIETGVAHGLTTRIVLEGMERSSSGHLWSIDLPASDPALHAEIGAAVPDRLAQRWSYVAGTSRQRLPGVLAGLDGLDLFVHDSLHTTRNTRYELDTVWPVLRPGGVAVVDDTHRNLGFAGFVDAVGPRASFTADHVLGGGHWGLVVKGTA